MIGETIAQYRVLEKLGEGGMGVVYKARDTRLERSVALKVLPAARIADPDRRRRFVQEARAASSLNHPNIVHIYDVSSSDDVSYIAMELVSGKTLDLLIGRRGLPLQTALKYAIQITDALAKAHAAGIVHRDLKPSNVMVTEDGLVKILDFGVAKLVEPLQSDESTDTATLAATKTAEGVVMGTVAYMSPEQAEGRPVDARSDIFSFGSVFHEMLTGQKAFHGDSRLSTMASILREEPPPVSRLVADTPRDVERVIQRCMRKDPARRFQHMDDLKVALEELRDESASGAGMATSPVTKKNRLLWPAVAIAVIAAVGWAVAHLSRQPAVPPTVVPFTAFAGSEQHPSFSPDGNHVAFSWSSEKVYNPDIYVKLIGPGSPLRLTTSETAEIMPAWSPDGRWIAFIRVHSFDEGIPDKGTSSLMIIPALGGVERRLGSIAELVLHFPAISWSADSKWIAVSDNTASGQSGISLYEVETGQRQTLTTAPSGTRHRTPSFAPNSRRIVFSQSSLDTLADLYLLELTPDYKPAGTPRRLTSPSGWVPSAAWMPDGDSIVYSSGQWGNVNLWTMSVSGSPRPSRLPFGEDGSEPAISRDGRRLVYTRSTIDMNIWRVDVGGTVEQLRQPEALIRSTRMDHTPAYSPDGRKVAYSSNQSGSWEIWVWDSADSRSGQLTSFGGPFTRYPTWSPDGRRIAFDSRPEGSGDIYVISADGGRPERLTDSPAMDFAPTWSRDGQWIYFNSNRSGRAEIWRMSASDPKNLTPITKGSALGRPIESADGKYIYFAREGKLWRVGPLDSTALEEVVTTLVLPRFSEFAIGKEGVFFFQSANDANPLRLRFFRFVSGRVADIAHISLPLHMGMSLSPDEKSLLYTQQDQVASDLMLVENFR